MPWLETRGDLPLSVGTNRVIEKGLIADYFMDKRRIFKSSMLSFRAQYGNVSSQKLYKEI